MKKKIVMTLLIGSLAAVTPAICFAAETVKAEASSVDSEADTEENADSEENTDTAENTDAAEESKTPLKTVGEEKEGCITFKLSNSTTKKITRLAIKASEKDEFPENMMEENDSFEVDEKKRIYFMEETEEPEEIKLEESGEADGAPATEEEENSNPEDPTAENAEEELKKYDLHITFEDESTADVYNIALEDLTTVVIREKNGIVYATYRSLSTKEKVNTYDAQKALADKAAEEAAAQAAAQQAAASQNTAQQAPSYDYTYDYDNADDYTYDYSNEGDQNSDSGENSSEAGEETPGDTSSKEAGGETTGDTSGKEAGGETTGDTSGGETGGETTGDTNGGETTGETPGDTSGGETSGDTADGEAGGDTTGGETNGGDGCLNGGLLN